jgi:hypothetical protein
VTENASAEMKPTLGLTGHNDECDGAHCSGRISLADLRRSSGLRRDHTCDVDWHRIRPLALPCHRRLLCGDGKVVSRDRQLLLSCGAGVSQPRQSLALCPAGQVYRRLGIASLNYWVYPGVMVGVIGVITGYLVGTLWPAFMSATNPGPAFMMLLSVRVLRCELFSEQWLHDAERRRICGADWRHDDYGGRRYLGSGTRPDFHGSCPARISLDPDWLPKPTATLGLDRIGHSLGFLGKDPIGDEVTLAYTYEDAGSGFWH